MSETARSYTCPRCGRTSHNENDAREGYCGACHDWTRDRFPGMVPFGLTPAQVQAADNAWASGRYTVEDAVDAMIADHLRHYSPLTGRRPDHVPLPAGCYRSEYGFLVHIRGACHCNTR